MLAGGPVRFDVPNVQAAAAEPTRTVIYAKGQILSGIAGNCGARMNFAVAPEVVEPSSDSTVPCDTLIAPAASKPNTNTDPEPAGMAANADPVVASVVGVAPLVTAPLEYALPLMQNKVVPVVL